ncbi:MAG: hypothetical protein MZW92_00040 [Comamonadaceae bacterium]|nr:hypothetical protein [Comamonadaceae bacterium]
MRFIAHLCRLECRGARGRVTPPLRQRWHAQQLRFMSRHLIAWVPAHCERLATRACTGYYAAVAVLIGRACKLALDELDPFTSIAVAA